MDTPPPVTAAAGELEEENPAKPVVTQPVEKKVKKMAMKIVRVGRENDFFILALLEESFITRKAGFTDFSMTILKWKSKNLFPYSAEYGNRFWIRDKEERYNYKDEQRCFLEIGKNN